MATRAALPPVPLLTFPDDDPRHLRTGQDRHPTNETPSPSRPLAFTGAAGKFPAWVWRALANAQRDARHDHIPVVIAQEALRKYLIVDSDDWSDLFTPSPEGPCNGT